MKMFALTLSQLLMMTTLILLGILLRKIKVLPENTDVSLSKLETFVFTPALSLLNLMKYCTMENFKKNSTLILYGLFLGIVALLVSHLLAGFFIRGAKGNRKLTDKKNIYKYALTFGNFGFMGKFLVLSLFGEEMLFKYIVFNFFLSFLCNSWGFYVLVPKEEGGLAKNLKKGLLSPPIVAIVLGALLGLLNVEKFIPEFIKSALSNASSCMGPCAMILAGIVIGGFDIGKLLKDKKVYAVTFLRLIVLPAFFILILNLLGAKEEIKILALIAYATPMGLNTIVFPAAYGGDTKTGASMTVISQTLSAITIPLMYLIFIANLA